MGWYAHGPGNLDWKYGDVVAVARESGLGRLFMVPQIVADFGEEDVELDDLEFLGPLQRRIQKLGLPWGPPIAFKGRGAEAVLVPPGADVLEMLRGYAEQVSEHVTSVLTAIERTVEDPAPVEELFVSASFYWELPKKDYGKLVAWLNGSTGLATKITLALLRKGKLEGATRSSLGGTFGWYHPPDELRDIEGALAGEHCAFAFHGLAQALLTGEKLVLSQPDDDYQLVAWQRSPPHRVLLFVPGQAPELRRLLDALDIPSSLTERVFYVAGDGLLDDALPTEVEDPAEHHAPGFRLANYVIRVLDGLQLLEHVGPLEDGAHELTFGWHASATPSEVEAAVMGAGLEFCTLSGLFDRMTIDRKTADPRLYESFLAKHGYSGGLQHVLDGAGDREVIPFVLGVLLLALCSVELDEAQEQRFRELILASEPKDD
jgi:hypothetical protein